MVLLSFRGAKVPEPPEGHKWQKVTHDNKVWGIIFLQNVCGRETVALVGRF